MMPKNKKEITNFIFLFSLCVIGAVAIFIFAVGIETGNTTADRILLMLLENVLLLVALCVVCLWVLWKVISKGSHK